MLTIEVLGPGCSNCEKVEATAQKAVINLGVQARIDKVTDYGKIMSYCVLSTPGLVINGEVVSAGRIPSNSEVTTWVANALETQ